MNSDEPKMVSTWKSSEPAVIMMFDNIVDCTRDEHCAFTVRGYADNSVIQAVDNRRIDFARIP